ncbi:unnamed protein product [Anisakis simplex]|uniref:Transposase n=1 Tax=Anisakis simplex TaxID=6269 RepID=A0A0M3IZZ6_ANISI|nr:unnamed protein product [Anisakis simplex]
MFYSGAYHSKSQSEQCSDWLSDQVAEWLRRWTANPLGVSPHQVAEWLRRWTANPGVSPREFESHPDRIVLLVGKSGGRVSQSEQCSDWLSDQVAEWLRRWTANPLGFPRGIPNLKVSNIPDWLSDQVAEWLRRWTANPLGFPRSVDEDVIFWEHIIPNLKVSNIPIGCQIRWPSG